jgi:hypothetical protein
MFKKLFSSGEVVLNPNLEILHVPNKQYKIMHYNKIEKDMIQHFQLPSSSDERRLRRYFNNVDVGPETKELATNID